MLNASGFNASPFNASSLTAVDAYLSGGVETAYHLFAGFTVSAVLSFGVATVDTVEANVRLASNLPLITKLTGGVHSDCRLTDADISSYYGDMWHNTWQLEITSATEVLEISTPIGDS